MTMIKANFPWSIGESQANRVITIIHNHWLAHAFPANSLFLSLLKLSKMLNWRIFYCPSYVFSIKYKGGSEKSIPQFAFDNFGKWTVRIELENDLEGIRFFSKDIKTIFEIINTENQDLLNMFILWLLYTSKWNNVLKYSINSFLWKINLFLIQSSIMNH